MNSRVSDAVPLEGTLPKRGYDGDWKHFDQWRRERPDAEDWTEKLAPFMVPRGTRNLALHKPVTSRQEIPAIGRLKYITDGKMFDVEEGHWVELDPGLQWVQIDLGRVSRVHAVLIWHDASFSNSPP